MKTLKSLFVLLLLTVSMAASAQTTMKEAFKAYLQANPSASNMNPKTMRMALELMNKSLIKNYDEAQSEELIEKYLNGPFWDDAIDAMLPIIENKINVNEVNELTTKLKSKKGKAFVEHWTQINEDGNFEQMGIDLASKMLSGEELTPVKPITCPAKYKKLFMDFYKASGQEELLTPMFDAYSGSFNSEQMSLMNQMKDYLIINFPTIFLNKSYGVLTEDDMKFGIELYNTQAWQNMKNAMKEVMSNPQETGMAIVMNYVLWLQDQGVDTNL